MLGCQLERRRLLLLLATLPQQGHNQPWATSVRAREEEEAEVMLLRVVAQEREEYGQVGAGHAREVLEQAARQQQEGGVMGRSRLLDTQASGRQQPVRRAGRAEACE